MQTSNEFAETYTRAERVRFIVVGTVAGAVVVVAGKLWLLPGLRAFATTAPCRTVVGIPGEVVLGYGVFAGLPLLAACVIASTVGRRGLRILRDGQAPPFGEKVLRPTRIVRGRRATIAGYAHVVAAAPLAMIALWGAIQGTEWSRHAGTASAMPCATVPQALRTVRSVPASSPDAAR